MLMNIYLNVYFIPFCTYIYKLKNKIVNFCQYFGAYAYRCSGLVFNFDYVYFKAQILIFPESLINYNFFKEKIVTY